MAQKHNIDYEEKPMTRDGRIQGPSRRYRRLRHPSFPAALWTEKNPLLQRGEIGIEIDTRNAKLGDGHTYWNDLPYALLPGDRAKWGDLTGNISDQTDLQEALNAKQEVLPDGTAGQILKKTEDGVEWADETGGTITDVQVDGTSVVTDGVANVILTGKQDVISDLEDIRSNAEAGAGAATTIAGYGDIVTHNASEFATPSDIPTKTSDLTNDSGFITKNVNDLTNYTKSTDLATVATSGSYADLSNIPTNVSDFTNDAGYITASYHDNTKQDVISAGNGIAIANNVVSTNTQFIITESMFDLELDDTKGVSPYNTSYGYTNVTIHDDTGIEWIEGAMYSFVLDTKVATSTYRNVRVRIGEDGDWKPLMVSAGTIASGATYFVKNAQVILFYKTTHQPNGALHLNYDANTTYTLNYSYDAGKYKSGQGSYAVTRYALCMQKPDGTWEKIVDPTKNYTTGTSKTVNTHGFLLNQIKYYNTTTTLANGAYAATNTMSSKSASVDMRYSTNCGTPASWVSGQYIYLVGTINDTDKLFYLDTTAWWTTSLPTTADGKLYIQIGVVLTDGSYTASFLDNRPVLYYDNGIKLYGGEGSGASEWGKIGGTLSNQTDLQNALNAKQGTLTAGTNITIEDDVISATGLTASYDAATKKITFA